MSPLLIDILLHYYTTPVEYRDGDIGAPAVKDGIAWLVQEDMLRPRSRPCAYHPPAVYETTERAEAYIKALTALPLPVMHWTIPKDEVGDINWLANRPWLKGTDFAS